MLRSIIVVLICSFAFSLQAQRYLQLEKKNSVQSVKFGTSDVISIKLLNQKQWWSGVIYDLNFDLNAIEFENRIVYLKDIDAVRQGKTGYVNNLMRGFSGSMVGFGASWALFSLADAAVTERSFTETDALISVGSAGLGYLMNKFFALRKYKIGKRWNFRLLNLDIIPVLENHPIPND